MVFPPDALSATFEIFVDDAWMDITSDVYDRDEVQITRGRKDEGSQVQPGQATLTLDNRTGRYSPRNPRSDLFGKIGRNTPLRVIVGAADPSPLILPGLQTAYVFSPSDSAFDIAGDLDIRIDVEPDDWAGSSDPAVPFALANRETFTWRFEIFNDGILRFRWADGVTGDPQLALSTVGISQIDPRRALRVTIDVDNGAGGNTVTFYTADTLAGSWTQLGATVVGASPTSFSVPTDNPVEIGRINSTFEPGEPFAGILYGFELRDGIGGTAVADPDFTALDPDPSFTDAAGRSWTIVGAAVTDPSLRFTGEVANWPQQWSPSGADIYTQIEVAGVLRRIGQGARPIGSALKRALTFGNGNPLVAYWPCEDLSGATEIASALSSADPIAPNPLPDFVASDLFKASSPLPIMTQDNDSEWRVNVPNYTPTLAAGEGQCSFLFHIDGTLNTGNQGVMQLLTQGPEIGAFQLVLTPDGFLQLGLRDTDDVLVDSSGLTSESVVDRLLYLNMSYQVGTTNITYSLRSLEIGQGESSGAILLTATHPTGAGMGKIRGLVANNLGNLTDAGARATIGHITVQGDQDTIDFRSRAEAFNAYVGEHALTRIQRLSAEEDEAFTFTDDPALTAAMGAQLPKTFVELIREAAVADQGILYEPRGALGLAYRSRVGLYNQEPTLALPYAGVFGTTPEPVDDDQNTRNDITVTRRGGSSARRRQAFGALSVQPPPNGVGRYEEAVTVNLVGDGFLPNDVSWRLSLGTVDEARYPSLDLQLASEAFASSALTADAEAADLGDRVTVTDIPEWLPPEDLSVLVQGTIETLGIFSRRLVFNTAPESPYRVGVYAEDEAVVPPDFQSRYSSAGTVTTAAFDAGIDTALAVGTLIRPYWTTDTANMPFDILVSGVRLRVTAISAPSGDFQTMTVQQAPINGIIKTIPIVSVVGLFQPAIYAL